MQWYLLLEVLSLIAGANCVPSDEIFHCFTKSWCETGEVSSSISDTVCQTTENTPIDQHGTELKCKQLSEKSVKSDSDHFLLTCQREYECRWPVTAIVLLTVAAFIIFGTIVFNKGLAMLNQNTPQSESGDGTLPLLQDQLYRICDENNVPDQTEPTEVTANSSAPALHVQEYCVGDRNDVLAQPNPTGAASNSSASASSLKEQRREATLENSILVFYPVRDNEWSKDFQQFANRFEVVVDKELDVTRQLILEKIGCKKMNQIHFVWTRNMKVLGNDLFKELFPVPTYFGADEDQLPSKWSVDPRNPGTIDELSLKQGDVLVVVVNGKLRRLEKEEKKFFEIIEKIMYAAQKDFHDPAMP